MEHLEAQTVKRKKKSLAYRSCVFVQQVEVTAAEASTIMPRTFRYQGRLAESEWLDVLSAPSREPRGIIDLALCQTPLTRRRTRAPSILWPRAVLSVSVYISMGF